jgi:type I restriction enzyme M protein
MEKLTLTCPIRGVLKASGKSADGLTPSEESLRVESIRYLLKHGYPKEHFKIEAIVKRFGRNGRNSTRADFAVLDEPVRLLPDHSVETLLQHSILLCEVKRDNNVLDYVKSTQVEPLLDFAQLDRCVALYWDNVDHRIFWQCWNKGKRFKRNGPINLLPVYGDKISVSYLKIKDLEPSNSLITLFERVEDILHQASIDPDKRYEIILQLILAKLFDENSKEKDSDEMIIQDFSITDTEAGLVKKKMDDLLGDAVSYYENYLPRKISNSFTIRSQALIEILRLLAPIRLTAAKREVIQTFYMKFAKDLYRWDLAQYFTPITVTDFIIDVLNPQYGEHMKDPACGSADFLTASFHKCREKFRNYSDFIWGSDNSTNAVQIAVLNMLFNGDGKTNIRQEDSLEACHDNEDRYKIVVCNPPFGTQILEKRKTILDKFDLGHKWIIENNGLKRLSEILDQQETGILFAEAYVKLAKHGGRIGIILPNGYLGNRSPKYHILREWLLRHCKLVSICSFPRFTFKSSGADVSASVVFLEKRRYPLSSSTEDNDYEFNVEMIETVGWNVGNKRGELIYRRNPEDGSYIIDGDGNKILDADFDKVLTDMRSSTVADNYKWFSTQDSKNDHGWAVPIKYVLKEDTRTIDPKRYCKKFLNLQWAIKSNSYFELGDIFGPVAESYSSRGIRIYKKNNQLYNYIEIQEIGRGEFNSVELMGWELPDRAKHFAEHGDLFIAKIWGSVEKWCIIGDVSKSYVVTNGCHRLRLKNGKSEYLPDIIAYLSSDSFATQMRALSRGSDGLAEVTVNDMLRIPVPIINNEARSVLRPFVDNLLAGRQNVHTTIGTMISSGQLGFPIPAKRPNHTVLV